MSPRTELPTPLEREKVSPTVPTASGSTSSASKRASTLPYEAGERLVDWYRRQARDLPWRRTRDPYAILVSEIMLQQTRVEFVRERYESFIEHFPDLASLATADVEEVLAEWSGLGYYRRARALHALAREVVAQNSVPPAALSRAAGRRARKRVELPKDPDELRSLPGIGPYTAAAVASIAFGVPVLAIDGNVGRVLCRLAAIEEDPKRAPVKRHLEELTANWFERYPAGDLNQGLMELGARVCLPRSPRCDDCPVAVHCQARAAGIQESIPPPRRQDIQSVTEAAAIIEHDGRYLLLRGQRPRLLQDMWEFPTLDSRVRDDAEPIQASLASYLEKLGLPVDLGSTRGKIRHGITNRRISCRVYDANWLGGEPDATASSILAESQSPVDEVESQNPRITYHPSPEAGWFTVREAAELPLAASARKIFNQVLDADLTPRRTPS